MYTSSSGWLNASVWWTSTCTNILTQVVVHRPHRWGSLIHERAGWMEQSEPMWCGSLMGDPEDSRVCLPVVRRSCSEFLFNSLKLIPLILPMQNASHGFDDTRLLLAVGQQETTKFRTQRGLWSSRFLCYRVWNKGVVWDT